jgi:photosystem II stability/assembly factor-like uncharacterized protein
MKKGFQGGIFFLFLFALLAACANDPRNKGQREPPEPTGWNEASDLSKGVFYALATDPTHPDVVYAASSTVSVYKTTDGGATWTAANRGLPGQPVRSLFVDPINPLRIYAAVAGGELFKTDDGGASWQVIGSGLAQNTAYAVVFNPYAPPTNMDIASGDTSNSLSWSAVPNATEYKLYFRTCPACTTPPAFDGSWTLISRSDPVALSHVHTGLTNGTPYYYVVTAMVGGEETTTSSIVSAVPTAKVNSQTPPPDATKVTAGDGQNTLRWGTVPGAGTFDVYRQATAGVAIVDGNRIAQGVTGTSYTDTTVTNGTPAYYVVTQSAAPTTPSPEVSATPAWMTALYVGTGGGGIFSSGPAGEFRKASNTGLGTGDGLDFSALLIDPTVSHTSPPTLYAGTRGGVYRSVDGGDNWVANNTGLSEQSVLSLVQGSGGTLYAGTSNGIFRGATDGSSSWVDIGVPSMGAVTSIAIDFADPVDPADVDILYATSATGGIFKSPDAGTTWSTINQGLTTTDIRSILVHPQNRNLLYAGGVGTVFKSTDGGGRWTAIDLGSLENVSNPLPEASIKSMISTAGNILYAGGSAGVFKSVNQGKAWTAVNTRLASREVQALAFHPDQLGILYAALDGDGIYKSLDGGGSWREENGPANQPAQQITKFVSSLVVDPGNPSRLYAGTSGGGVFRGTVGADGHLTWEPIDNHLSATLPTGGVQSLAILPGGPPTLYAGMFQNGIFKVVDDGSDTWVRVTEENPDVGDDLSDRSVSALAIHPESPSIFFAGTTTGLFKSNNGGATWSAASDLDGIRIHFITFDSDADPPGSEMYVGTDSGVFKSVDEGANWTPLADGMASPVYAILVDPQQNSIVYAGTVATGIYRRTQ